MNITDYTYLINKPDAINEKQTETLDKVLEEFPYFQSARALQLKGLYNQNSFKYNGALKVTAAHTTDRTVLFDFITSDIFTAIQKKLYDKKTLEILDIKVHDSELISVEEIQPTKTKLEESILTSIKEATPIEIEFIKKEVEERVEPITKLEQSILTSIKEATPIEVEFIKKEVEERVEPTTKLEQSILTSIKEASPIEVEENKKEAEEHLEIGKPLDFSNSEKHSFQEWLQLSQTQPIVREIIDENILETRIMDEEKRKKAALIDKFIETSPKISPVKHGIPSTVSFDLNKEDNSYLMTETLARVYLEQKKYQKAIQAYEILILKYPEKSSFFASHISDIKILQQNNNK